ncbi:MAG: glycosyltransferase family 4 protein [Candidatus Doudnabacteria bacterium]|nr:glycosyltransferase family 4 protein [Candidatus Doudnabacteria bacterium]
MNILYVITQADGGGAQNYTLTLAKHFGGQIAAGDEATELFQKAESLGIKTYKLEHLKRNISPWHDFIAMWEIRQLIDFIKPDVVHLNSSKAGILGSFACVGLKTKVVFTAHGFVFNEPLPWLVKSLYISLERVASSYRNHIIAVSEADKRSALQYQLIDAGKISVIHNGLAPINFVSKDEAKLKLNIPDGKLVVGTIAGLYKTKGLDTFIQAIPLLNDEIKNKCQFLIVGDGPEADHLKFKIRDLKLDGMIMLPGKIDNAKEYLKAFDMFIMSSRKEGFPYSLLEAMQAGLPIIATNVGGVPEALGDAGMLVYPEKPEELAEKITELINSTHLREQLSNKAIKKSEEFTEEKMLQATNLVYKKLLA